jgi:hypothetical protein
MGLCNRSTCVRALLMVIVAYTCTRTYAGDAQMAVRPYAAAVNNRFETACAAGLVYEYFVSIVSGLSPSSVAETSVTILKAVLVGFASFRAARSQLRCARHDHERVQVLAIAYAHAQRDREAIGTGPFEQLQSDPEHAARKPADLRMTTLHLAMGAPLLESEDLLDGDM